MRFVAGWVRRWRKLCGFSRNYLTMKKTIIAFLLITGAVLGTAAQDKNKVDTAQVPAAVKTAFSTTFPNSSDMEWMKKDNHYKVAFMMNNSKHYAKFDESGKVMSRGMEIPVSQLPAPVSAAIQKDYPNYKVEKAYTEIENGTTNYKVSFEGKEDRKIMYDATGTRLKE